MSILYLDTFPTLISFIIQVELYYKHFRPTGKAILTLTLPDYARDAVHRLEKGAILGANLQAEPIEAPQKLHINSATHWQREAVGDGPSAGVSPGRSVVLYGLPGKTSIEAVQNLVKDFKLGKVKGHPPIQIVPL